MNNLPDFSQYGYQIISQLGENHLGGRVTYLAQSQTSQVVIKQFQFAQMGATWAEYDAYEQEIAMLRQLNHPGIAKYIDAFQTPNGFCMVQQYLEAESLATPRSWTPKQIKQIAISLLQILVYLQSQNPSVIHRDIKPENILVDPEMNIYLVDFGFARIGGGDIAASSVVKGTMGFMPPEQLFNRQLTTASDLYGLGGTLICLLTGTKSVDIGNLIDADYRINFRHLVPPVKRGLISWLEKLADPRLTHRYFSAANALAALKPIDVDRLPKVRLSHKSLEITATEFGEILTKTITISNPIPDTILSGRFSVAPHPSDPPHTPYDHAWISFEPQQFSGNEVECKITIDTSKLLAGKSYTREVVLHSNSSSDSDRFSINLHTAPLPSKQKPSYWSMFGILVASWLIYYLPGMYLFVLGFCPGWIPVVVTLETTQWAKLKGYKVDFLGNYVCTFVGQLVALFVLGDIVKWNLVLLLPSILLFSVIFSLLFIIQFVVTIRIKKLIFKLIKNLLTWTVLVTLLLTLMLIPLWILYLTSGLLILSITIGGFKPSMMSLDLLSGAWDLLLMRPIINLLNLQTPYQVVSLMTAAMGLCLGAGYLTYINITENVANMPVDNIFFVAIIALIPVLITSITLVSYLIKRIKQANNIIKYRRSESSLIKP